jgi:hypothetical protein
MRKARLALLAAWLLAGACTTDIMDGGSNSGGDFAIGVSSGTQPTYSWSAGPAFEVSLVRASDETRVVWRVVDTNRQMQSPVRQGITPAGATETASAERVLTPGILYRVSIRLADQRSAFQEFRP